jgi:hypothetical protein
MSVICAESVAFNKWVDRVLDSHAEAPASAFNFNLYEHADMFAIQLIGAAQYDPDDADWGV